MLVTDPDNRISYVPGAYAQTSSDPSAHFTTPLNQTVGPNASDDTSAILVTHPSRPAAFSKSTYKGDVQTWDPLTMLDKRQRPMEDWKSLYLPQNWYAVPSDAQGQVYWGAVVDEKELPRDMGRGITRMSSSGCLLLLACCSTDRQHYVQRRAAQMECAFQQVPWVRHVFARKDGQVINASCVQRATMDQSVGVGMTLSGSQGQAEF